MNFGNWIGFIVLILCLSILWEIRQLLLLLFTAIVLANGLNLLVKRLQNWGVNRPRSLFIAFGLLLGVIIGAFLLVIPPFVAQVQELVKLVPEGIEKLINRLVELASKVDPELIQSLPSLNEILQELQPLINQIANRGLNVFYSSLGTVLSLLLLLALTLMLLANPSPYCQGLIRLFPSFYRRRVGEILAMCDRALSGWLTTIICHMMVMTILSWLGLLILHIPLAFSQALVSGFLTFIPNIGPVLSMIPPIAISLLEDPWKPWAVIILYGIIYVLIQQLDNKWLAPKVLKQHISILPGVSLMAQIFCASLFGFLGLFLALPLLIVGQIWFKEALVKDILDQW